MPDPETITVGAGETHTMSTSDRGGTIENVLFDISASGAVARVFLDSHNGTVRNVAWRGTQDTQSYAVFEIRGSGDMLIENVYMGDGSSTGHSAGQRDPTAMWGAPEATGTLTVRNVNVQGWSDNGLYLSSMGAVPTIERCYAADNANAEYRVGQKGAEIRESVARNSVMRGVWCYGPGEVDVRNCHIHAPDSHSFWAGQANNPNATINVYDTEYVGTVMERYSSAVNLVSGNGNSPQDFYPQGCPTTPMEAASGGTGGGAQLDRTLRVQGAGVETDYRITVSGDIEGVSDTIEPGDDTIGDGYVEGFVMQEWDDQFRFSGNVTSVEYLTGGPIRLYIDGTEVSDPLSVGQEPDQPDDGGDTPDDGGGGGGGGGGDTPTEPTESGMPMLAIGLLAVAMGKMYGENDE